MDAAVTRLSKLVLLSFDAEGLGDAFFGALALVAAVDDVADCGVGDAQASRQFLLGNVLFYHCDFHFLSKWGAWDSVCHVWVLLFY